MTSRQMIQLKPPIVIQVIRCLMTRESIDLPGDLTDDKMEQLAHNALAWWSKIYLDANEIMPTGEVELATCVLEGLRRQEVWGNAN